MELYDGYEVKEFFKTRDATAKQTLDKNEDRKCWRSYPNIPELICIIDLSEKSFKVTEFTRTHRRGMVARSLKDVTSKAREKLRLQGELTVVLESDGTEIDDDEYFATLDEHTSLMVLTKDQQWQPPAPPCNISTDCKGGPELAGLIGQLKNNLCHISLLGGPELELLSDMDPDSIINITFLDKVFLEQLKECSGRYLSEKRQAQEAMDFLRLYQEKEAATKSGNHQ